MSSVIGKSAVVRGKVRGDGDLEVQGHVEGEITVSGDVTVEAGGLVGAAVNGRRIVVRGAVRGDLVASEAIELGNGARVVGDVRAPRIAITEGALVRGHVQTQGAGASSTPRAAATSRAAATPVKATPAPVRAATPARAPAPAARPVPAPAPSTRKVEAKPAAGRGSVLAGARPAAPPPMVVPVLKKGTKVTKKR